MAILLVLLLMLATTLGSAQNMTDILHSKEILVEQLASAAKRAYDSRCTTTCPNCILSACSSPKSQLTTNCTTLYGSTEVSENGCLYQCSLRRLDHTTSNILTASKNESMQLQQEKCWTSALDREFVSNSRNPDNGRDIRWQYFASNSGLTRLYPAHTLRECHVVNPLIRPWYVAATSGPKNIILVLDVSASVLNYGRLDLAIAAATTVVETLTNVDYVTVVLFSDTAEQLLVPNQPQGSLLRASYDNITSLSEAVREITANPAGGTNYEAAFLKAFDILDRNSDGPNFANCSTALLFLTDGFPNTGSTSQDFLIDLVRKRNRNHNAIIFTYTLGSNSGAALARGIACETSGVYTHINDGGRLREQLSLYYDYFALLRQTDNVQVAWVEPYMDAVGAGLLVTASKAVYDTSITPPRIVGVVGMDVLVSDLRQDFEARGLDYRDVVNFLASRNVCPSISRFNESVLDAIRVQGGGEPCGVLVRPARSVEGCSNATSDYCDFEYGRYASDADLYREESCCFGGGDGVNASGQVTLLSCGGGASLIHFRSNEIVVLMAALVVLLLSCTSH